jgi:hypothetical protein
LYNIFVVLLFFGIVLFYYIYDNKYNKKDLVEVTIFVDHAYVDQQVQYALARIKMKEYKYIFNFTSDELSRLKDIPYDVDAFVKIKNLSKYKTVSRTNSPALKYPSDKIVFTLHNSSQKKLIVEEIYKAAKIYNKRYTNYLNFLLKNKITPSDYLSSLIKNKIIPKPATPEEIPLNKELIKMKEVNVIKLIPRFNFLSSYIVSFMILLISLPLVYKSIQVFKSNGNKDD